jgi:molybdate transport system substrate-binding protein
MLKKFFLFFILGIFLNASVIKIAVAANVSFAIDDLIASFHVKYPKVKVDVILGSSGMLNTQIKNGAPFDIFMSANMKYPQDLYNHGFALNPPKLYVQGALAIFSPKKRDLSKGIYLAKNSSISRIAIANPKTAPYGKATLEALKNAKIYDEVKNKFVYAQSISQTVQYALSATDIGFIAKSSLFSSKMKRFKRYANWIEVDKNFYTPIKQGVVIIKKTKNMKEAKEFYDFIFSSEAKKVFKRYGYL